MTAQEDAAARATIAKAKANQTALTNLKAAKRALRLAEKRK